MSEPFPGSGARPDASAARAAKTQISQLVAGDPRVNGIGLTRSSGDWAVKVNVVDGDDYPDLPDAVDGVGVRVAVVGRITPSGTVPSGTGPSVSPGGG